MSPANRDVASLVAVGLSGTALWFLPDQVRGDNQLFGANGTLLPALALSLICGLSILDLIRSYLAARRSRIPLDERRAEDAKINMATIAGMGLVSGLALLFAVSLRTVGYAPAAVVLVLALMFGTGGRNVRVNLAVSIAAVFVLFVGVRYGLGVRLQLWPNLANWAG